MRKIHVYALLLASIYSTLTYCMKESPNGSCKVEDGYEFQLNPLSVTFKNKKREERFTLNGDIGEVKSLIIKSDLVFCATMVLPRFFDEKMGYTYSQAKHYVYMWDLKKKWQLCGLCTLLKNKTNIDLNKLIGLNPVYKIPCNFDVENIDLVDDYRLLVTKGRSTILKIPQDMRRRFKKSDRQYSYKTLREQINA